MSVFGPTLRFKGELKAQEDIKIEGRIEGSIHHQQRVIVGTKGEVVATVNAQSIDVVGKIQGDMVAKKSVKVSQSAVVRGQREHHRGSKFQWRSHDGVECWVARILHLHLQAGLRRRRP